MRLIHLFAGKGVVGVLLSFFQTVILVTATGGLDQKPLIIIVTLLLGSMMLTGLAFFIASISKEMMSVIAWGSLFLFVLGIPAFTVIFRASLAGWMKLIPSYSLVDILHRAINYNIGWEGNLNNIFALIGFNILIILLGLITLKGKLKWVLEG
jgi:ABC-2 type transport system permease protein